MKKPTTLFMLAMALLFSTKLFSTPKLNSLPGASATIYLDFDGYYVNSSMWNGGTPFTCAAAGMTDAQVTEVFNRISEDYRPFTINITTDSTVYLAAPLVSRMRVVITPTSAWYPGVGGIAFIGSFNWGDETPCFVFCDRLGPNSPKEVAESAAHEAGHTLGLSHQSKYGSNCSVPIQIYNTGTGTGETGWAPIMGCAYSENMSNWNNGPTPYGCTNVQDNLSIISSQNTNVTYIADDYGQTMNSNTYNFSPANFSVNGIISTNTDKDAFRFVLSANSNFHLSAIPFNVGSNDDGADLDIKLELYNSSATLIQTYDPQSTMSVTVDTILNAGTYYLMVYGTGNANIDAYGSLGSYTLSGTSGILPIHDVSLSGTVNKNIHDLNWSIISDDPIKTINVETSLDGINFQSLTSLSSGANTFAYNPYQNNNIFYRLKVTSVLGQSMYSNIIVLKGTGNTDKQFFVSTLVQTEIMVNAAVNYQYQITDMNGRRVSNGSGLKGINKIFFANQPGGMYIIQLFNNNQIQTEKIIKQ